MSDITIPTQLDSPTVSEPVTEAPAPVDAFEPGEGESVVTPGGERVFTESYVKKIREEAATYRTKARSLEEQYAPFAGLDDGDRQWFLDAATKYSQQGLEGFREYAKPLYEDLLAAGATPAEAKEIVQEANEQAAEEAGEKPLTQKQLDEILEKRLTEREQQAAKQREIQEAAAQIDATLSEAGYVKGTYEYTAVLTYAAENRLTIEAAIEARNAERQKIIDDFVASKAAGPKTVSGTAGAEMPQQPSSIREAARMAAEWEASQRRAGSW